MVHRPHPHENRVIKRVRSSITDPIPASSSCHSPTSRFGKSRQTTSLSKLPTPMGSIEIRPGGSQLWRLGALVIANWSYGADARHRWNPARREFGSASDGQRARRDRRQWRPRGRPACVTRAGAYERGRVRSDGQPAGRRPRLSPCPAAIQKSVARYHRGCACDAQAIRMVDKSTEVDTSLFGRRAAIA